jgi:TonB family protein
MISFIGHVCVLTGVVWMSRFAPAAPPRVSERKSLTLYVSPAPISVVLDKPAVPAPSPAPLRVIELPHQDLLNPPTEVPALPEPRRVEPRPAFRETSAPVAAPPAASTPPPPQKTLTPIPQDVFQASAPSAQLELTGKTRHLQDTAFEAPTSAQPATKARIESVVGGFDSPVGGVQASGNRRSASVAPTGFSANEAAPQPRRAETVRDTGFDPAPTARPSVASQRIEPIGVPVEITFKPKPSYTEEARMLKLEGEVLLEIEFAASGQIRVVRVVRGLGHGLDESAIRAAEQIRFRPAQSNGRSVDVHAIVHIEFRLA